MPSIISVVVPLSGGPAQALGCFEGIAAQADDPSHEIIVVDDASVGLEELLGRLAGDVQVVRNDRRIGYALAARRGAEHAQGDIVVFIRDAAAPAPGWLAPLATALEDPSVGVATSATAGSACTSPVAAWAFAVRAADLRSAGIASLPGELLLGALAVFFGERGQRVVEVPASVVSAPSARTGGARGRLGEKPELTIIIPTLDAASDRVRASIAAVQARTDAAHEIVVVDNGNPPQGFAGPVNAGVRAARTPYVVVMNDDVEPLAGWWAPLRSALDAGASVVFPFTVDGAMRFDFAAWCFAMTQATIDEFSHAPGEFFDPGLVVWYQDTDLLCRLRQAGRPPVLVESSQIRHGLSETVATADPELSAWIRSQIAADRAAFISKHPDVLLDEHALAK